MDLILLEPGDQDGIFGKSKNDWEEGGSLIDNAGLAKDIQIEKCIELVSVHQGMKQQVTTDVSNSARTSGRPVVTEFTCVKYVDKTSVKFFEYCLSATVLGAGAKKPTKIHICRNSGENTANIMSFELRDALISEIQLQSHPNDMPTEQFKLNFTEILWYFNVQKADAKSLAGKIASGWSLAHNRVIGKFT